MAEPMCEDEGILQEWAPETRLLQQIPLRAQRGIFAHDLNLTCLDVVDDYIALGTNAGLVYWYCRRTAELQRLRFENSNATITNVKVVSTVDYMVAAGTNQGTIAVFQIPKQTPDSVPEALKPKNKQVERFTINGLHNAPITSIEWSQNGMKLFSGDKNGLVVLTEIDFYMHLSKSTELLNEQFEIVQISYCQQMLVISTLLRCIICNGNDKWKVHQVGTKERKILGKFGACLAKYDHGNVVYASRPGHRVWLADKLGSVHQTLIFKSAVQATHPRIQLINPFNKPEPYDTTFGRVLQFGDNKLIVHNSEVLYVLHPGAVGVISSLECARKILDVAVNQGEIYVLEGERSVLRIGHLPDPYLLDMSSPPSRRTSFIFDELAAKLKGTAVTSLKKITSEFLVPTDQISPPAMADEAMELPPIVNLTIPETSKQNGTVPKPKEESASAIADGLTSTMKSELEYVEEVLSRPIQWRKPKRNKNIANLQMQVSGHESESDTTSTTSEDRFVWGTTNDLSVSEESVSVSQSQSSFSVLQDIPSLLPSCSKVVKTPEDSVDTCESVSEHLALTPQHFLEEQERTFIRLANQDMSLLDSYNSEKTENMSISLNLTPSSSASSRISEQSTSEESENVSMVSDHSQTDQLPLPRTLCFYNEKLSTETSSISSESSQRINRPTSLTTSHDEYQPDMRSPETIRLEVRNNERILSQLLGMNLTDEDAEPYEQIINNCLMRREEGNVTDSDADLEPHLEPGPSQDKREPKQPDFPYASLNGMSYGPPSGSSNPSLDIPTAQAVFCSASGAVASTSTGHSLYSQLNSMTTSQLELIEPSDRWLSYSTPQPIGSLAVCDKYVVCCDITNQVYYSDLSGLALSWAPLEYKASQVSVSPDGSLVWFLGPKKVAYALREPSTSGPFSENNIEAAEDVRYICVDSTNEVWFLKCDGQIRCQRKLVRMPCGRSEPVPCLWLLTSIACNNGLILGITSDEALVCKARDSTVFAPVCTPRATVTAICIGPDDMVWIADDEGSLYFTDDVQAEQPEWWQVLISEYLFQTSPSHTPRRIVNNLKAYINLKSTGIVANASSVWVYDRGSATLHVNKTDFTGYIWSQVPLIPPMARLRWHSLCAEGVFEDKGHLWLLSVQGDLFCGNPTTQHFQSITSPTEQQLVCVAACADTLWVVSSDGRVYSRLGLTDLNLTGTTWRELNLPQLSEVRLVWVSCGCDVAWACDSTGKVYITIGSPHHMATNIFDAAWLEVEGKAKDSAAFQKVFVGPQLHMVWAIDKKQRVYVRQGIFANYQIGTDWVYVSGIEATHLSVSGSSVWAVAPDGHIYRRHGISESNYIGDYWKRIPGNLQALSSSYTDHLWGMDAEGKVLRLRQRTEVLRRGNCTSTPTVNPSSEDGEDWEVVL